MVSSDRPTKMLECRESRCKAIVKLVPFQVICDALPQPWTGFRPERVARRSP
jgi:hypothetical protein